MSATELPNEMKANIQELNIYISNTNALWSVLYDMDLLPEQLKEGTKDFWRCYMLAVSLTTPDE